MYGAQLFAFRGSQKSIGNQGIGAKTIEMLLTQFKSVNEISKQDLEALSQVIGRSKAKIVFEYYHSNLEE